MRTKLDEIVEEEVQRAGATFFTRTGPDEMGKRIAERAFRHGVEGGVATAPYMKDGRSYIVQPEPVGERPIPAPHCPARCGGPHSLRASDGTYHCNTRKGQRRKDERGQLRSFIWQLPEDTRSYGSIFKDDEAECWRWDRRHIKDRRKS
jgi:hypothetical protein